MTLRIYFENVQDREAVTYGIKMLIRSAILSTLDYEGKEGHSEVSVTFTDNEGIRAINREYREKDAPTDVLSFPLFEEGADGTRMLGDIVISLEKCRAQAEEFGHSFERECAFLTVHSTLHLLGYDHVNGGIEAETMREKEETVLLQMGLTREVTFLE